jgi:hypothetical protein
VSFATGSAGSNSHSFDFGFYQPAELGNFVWLDSNRNGRQDSGEQGVSGVSVSLLNSAGSVVSSQVTNSTGFYLFSNLAPGTYSVVFSAPNGYAITDVNQGGDDALDSDADLATGGTSTITLAAGESNLTLDCGLYVLACDQSLAANQLAITGRPTVDPFG